MVETSQGAAPHFPVDLAVGGETAVGTGPFSVDIELDPPPDPAWLESALRTSEEPVTARFQPPLRLGFRRGDAGTAVELSLSPIRLPKGSGGGKALTLTFRREAAPMATVLVKAKGPDGEWRAYSGRPERGPLQLKMEFSTDACRVCSEKALAGLGAQAAWLDARTLVLSFADRPGHTDVPLLHDRNGFYYHLVNLPLLVAYDPETGLEIPVYEVVEDVWQAFLSPDAGKLLAKSLDGDSAVRVSWIIETATGRRRQLDEAPYCGWSGPDSLVWIDTHTPGGGVGYQVVDVSRENQTVLRQEYLPEIWPWRSGVVQAGLLGTYSPDSGTGGTDDLRPCSVCVANLDTGVRVWIVPFVSIFLPPDGQVPQALPAFSPDGSLVAAPGDLAEGGEIKVARLEGDGGRIVDAVLLPEADHISSSYFSWSPDGRWWLAGEKLVATSAPHEVKELPFSGEGKPYTRGKPYWSPDGKWLARGLWPDWGSVELVEVDTGKLTDLGDGFPCGWGPDGKLYLIRWVGFEQRRQPEGG